MSLSVPTAEELYLAAQAEIQARQANLTDWNAGSALDAITGGIVILADQSIRIGLDQFAGKMIATATGSDLDAAVLDKYPELPRLDETAAIGTLRFTRGGSSGILTIAAGTIVTATVLGRTITVTTDAEVAMAAISTYIDATATCTETGMVGNLAPNLLTTLPTPLPGDATATVTNPERFVGGVVAEDDDTYRARAQAYPSTLRRATVAALIQGAMTVPGVAYVSVDESDVALTGIVNVYVGDPDGSGNDALAALVTTELENWRAAGVRIAVFASAREEIDMTLDVYVATNRGTDALSAAIRAAVVAYSGSLAPNTDLYLSAAQTAAQNVSTDVRGVVATSTATTGETIEPTNPDNALRLTPDSVTVTFNEVP